MNSVRTAGPRSRGVVRLWRRLERLLIGIGMSVLAWPLERAVLRSTRRKRVADVEE